MNSNFIHRPLCELCGSTNSKILLAKPFLDSSVWNFINHYYEGRISQSVLQDHYYEIRKCRNCSFIWQGYILNPHFMTELYNSWIDPSASLSKKREADISLFLNYARQMETISHLFHRKPHEIKVLDFGMGWGYWCLMAKAFGYSVWGMEISEARINYASSMNIEVIGDLTTVAQSVQFDFINCEQVFEHIANPLDLLNALKPVLKNNGVIRVAVPNGQKAETELKMPNWQASKNALHPLEHINCFTHNTLTKLGEAVGLEKIPYVKSTATLQNIMASMKHSIKSILRRQRTSIMFRNPAMSSMTHSAQPGRMPTPSA